MIKIHFGKVRINQGGYDRDGRYWGVTDIPLYSCEYEYNGKIYNFEFRAADREAARLYIANVFLNRYPGVNTKFYGPYLKANPKQEEERFKR